VTVRAVLFDFDFTLGDSADAIVHCSRAAFGDMGLEPAAPAAIRRTIGLTLQESFRVLTGEREPARAEQYRRRYVAHADDVMTAMTTVYPPAAAVLALVRSRGLSSAIVSTKYRYRIESILASAGLTGAVDVIVGGEDVAQHKPHPEGLQRALAGLGVANHAAVYVGDHPVDGHAARDAGVRYVRVLSGEHFDEEHWTGIQPVATIPDIGSLPDALDVLKAGGVSRFEA
jgi:phosphoglycolate phosphatase